MAKGFRETDYDIVLDAVCPKNGDTWFSPARYRLRGELRSTELKAENNGALNAVGGTVPGQRMLVDTKTRHVKIIDRMTLPEHKALDQEIRRLFETEQFWPFRFTEYAGDYDAQPSEEEWPKWLYCMRRCVDHGTMRLVRGELPTAEACRRMGDMTFCNDVALSPKEGKPAFNVLPKITDKKQPALEVSGKS